MTQTRTGRKLSRMLSAGRLGRGVRVCPPGPGPALSCPSAVCCSWPTSMARVAAQAPRCIQPREALAAGEKKGAESGRGTCSPLGRRRAGPGPSAVAAGPQAAPPYGVRPCWLPALACRLCRLGSGSSPALAPRSFPSHAEFPEHLPGLR